MEKIFVIVLLFISVQTFGQLTEDFLDNDFTSNPVWTPDNPANWTILNGALRSNSPTLNSSFFITTPSAKATQAQWEFFVNLQFNTSSANFVDVYLSSQLTNLSSASNNGYFIRIGGTTDEISLYKMSAGTPTILINGIDGVTNTSNNSLRIKVVRNAANQWTLERDATGGTNYFLEGAIADNTFSTGNFFGIKVQQSTVSFINKHFFDDIYAGNIIVDTTPPVFQSVQVISNTELDLLFGEALDQASSETLNNFIVDNGIGNPVSAVLQVDKKTIKLLFNNPFANGVQNQITVSGIKDLIGNSMISTPLSFLYFVPQAATFNDLVITELFPDPNPQIGLPAQEFVEIFNRSTIPFDLAGWKLSDPGTTATLPSLILLPGEYVIVTSTAAVPNYTPFGKVIGLSNFPTLNNGSDAIKLTDPSDSKIDSVHYDLTWYQDDDKGQGGWTLERLNSSIDTNEPTNWQASDDVSGGTPGKKNSVLGKNPDSKPPQLLKLTVTNANEIVLDFNEALNDISAKNATHYLINNIDIPSAIVLSPDAKSIQLHFDNAFINGVTTNLSIAGIQDLAGNTILDIQKPFVYFIPVSAKAKDLLITELMADPTPVVQLPEAEYIEIFNFSVNPFDLAGWKIVDATGSATLPTHIILPNEFLILTSTANVSKFASYGKVLGVTSFPSLNNSGEPIVLKNSDGLLIDSVFYKSNWYQDKVKQDGGWSLERLLYNFSSTDSSNWRAAEDVVGGTPGKQNSLLGKNPDSKPPQLLKLTVTNANEIILDFKEALNDVSVKNATHYLINNIDIPSAIVLSPDAKSIQLHFDNAFINGVSINLSITGIQDLAGNTILDIQKPFIYFIPVSAKAKDLLITELMADPTPVVQLPEAEYIEIFNFSVNPFDLAGWKIVDATGSATLSQHIILPNEFLILTSTANASALSSNGKVLGVSGFPSLNNSGEPIVLKSPDGLLIDSVFYKSNWYQDKVKQDGGWSLERLLYNFSSTDSSNWRASEEVTGGTPGKENSLLGKNPDSKAPKLLSVAVIDDKQLALAFDEPLQSAMAQDVSHFNVNDIGHPSTAILSANMKSIQLAFTSSFTNGVDFSLLVLGIQDLGGNTMPDTEKTFRYFISTQAKAKDVLLTEIMADPTPAIALPEAEYLEIFNPTSVPFDLAGWKIVDATGNTTLPQRIILPNEFLILTSTTNVSKFTSYGKTLGISGFPSLNNSGEPIVLKNSDGIVIDSVFYKSNWYQDKVKQDGGWSLERLLYNFSTTDSTNWRASEDITGGTPGKQNSLFGKNPDSMPPKLVSVNVLSDNQLVLNFDEVILLTSAQNILNFNVNNIGKPSSAILSTSSKSIQLLFSSSFVNGVDFYLITSGIQDLMGNIMSVTEKSFRYFIETPSKAKNLLITEIMADPSPVVQLPEAEYIEVFNSTNNPFDLIGWKLSDATTTTTLASHIILPNEFLILTSTSNVSKYLSFGKILGVTSFPSLNNAGETLVLKNSLGQTIDSVNYSLSWYRDNEKSDGGWSLELIDPQNKCGEEDNWTSSENEKGGTPGKTNSVLANKPDLTGPIFLSVTPVAENQLTLQFNEKLERDISTLSLSLSPEINITKASFTDLSLRQIRLDTETHLLSRTLYTIKIQNLRDCNGNNIQNEFSAVEFALPEKADSLDLLINEILFNPKPGGTDFLEIYNNSPKYINLKNWKLANSENGSFKNEKVISKTNFIVAPGAYVVFTDNAEVLKNNYPQGIEKNFFKMTLPGFSNDEGDVVLINEDNHVIDYLSYTKNDHSPLIKDEEGVSLERISFTLSTNDHSNWESASASAGYATPGYVNSNTRPENPVEKGNVVINPEIFSAGSGSSEFAQIQYSFEQSGYIANIKIYDQEGRSIKEISNNESLGYEGFFRWDGDRSDGSKARNGYYTMWMEVFDLEGRVQTYRKRVVIASR